MKDYVKGVIVEITTAPHQAIKRMLENRAL